MRRLAVIPARGGSKRLPRKNVMDFGGKPMIAWTIEAARESGLFSRVIVSTEDNEIAACAQAYGVEVPFRRPTAFDDYAPVSAATAATMEQCRTVLGEEYDQVVQLFAVCPLRTAEDIKDAVAAFETRGAPFQLSCFRYGWMNPWWALKLDDAGRSEALFPKAMTTRSQDLPPLFCPSGAIWIAKPDALRASNDFYGPDHRWHPLPWTSAVDIDDAEDLAFARAILAMRSAGEC